MQRSGGGSIITISSIAGLAGMGQPHYATAKAGLLGLTRSLAHPLGPLGIRINANCPGAISTAMTDAVPEPMLQPLIATTAVYLASADSSFVTDQWISPYGGIFIG